MAEKQPILVASSKELLPVCKALSDFPFVVLSQDFYDLMVAADLKAVSIGKIVDGNDTNSGLIQSVKVLKEADGYQPSARELGQGAARWINENGGAFLYKSLADFSTMVYTLDRIKPGLVMVHNDVEPLTRLIALWARSREVPCLHVPHAIYQDVNRGGVGTDIHDMVTASHLAVAGEFQATWYKKRKAQNIRITGLPQHDKLALPAQDRSRALRLLQLIDDPSRPIITYASTWYQDTNALGLSTGWEKCYRAFLSVMKKYPQFQVVVKCHPGGGSENWEWHAKVAGEMEVAACITPDHLPFVLIATDLIIGYMGSNVLLEAATYPGMRLLTTHGYEQDEAVGKIADPLRPEAFEEAIINSLNNPPIPATGIITKYLGMIDGRAHQRVAAYARELYNDQNVHRDQGQQADHPENIETGDQRRQQEFAGSGEPVTGQPAPGRPGKNGATQEEHQSQKIRSDAV